MLSTGPTSAVQQFQALPTCIEEWDFDTTDIDDKEILQDLIQWKELIDSSSNETGGGVEYRPMTTTAASSDPAASMIPLVVQQAHLDSIDPSRSLVRTNFVLSYFFQLHPETVMRIFSTFSYKFQLHFQFQCL